MKSFFFSLPSWRYFSVVSQKSPKGLDNDLPAEVYFKVGWSRALCCELDEDGYPVRINFEKSRQFGPFTLVDDSITYRLELIESIRGGVQEAIQEAFAPLLQELDDWSDKMEALLNARTSIQSDDDSETDEERTLH